MAETETRSLPIIEEEEIDEDFYEKIEAPKFVDLTAPDHRRSHDDRHWFCLRVGCDQKHEQELDSEAIYKDFVLRVMAARSPNVRLTKTLNRGETSENLKCSQTAPAKPRMSRMAFISSLSHKVTDNNVKVAKPKPLSKVAATPKAKVKQSPSKTKALTTPRNQKKVSNIEQFRSVQNKKAMNVGVPKSRMVAKALVFHSPKKVVKTSIELKSSMKALCSAMKKLEVNGVKKNGEGCNNSLPIAPSRKKFKGREIKSRVFDSLYSNNRKEQESNTAKCQKEKKVKAMQKQPVIVPFVERLLESETSEGGNENSQEPTTGDSSVLVLSEASIEDTTSLSNSNEEEKKTIEGSENEEQRNLVSDKGKAPEVKKKKNKENSIAFDDKENEIQLTENSDKENASTPSENIIAMSINNEDPKRPILGSKQEDKRTCKKSTPTSIGSQVVKYRKLKPTNPKPFKFRTDERGILKEANLEKKVSSPLKETSVKDGKAIGKLQNKNETGQDSYSSCNENSNQSDNFISKVQQKLSATTPNRNPRPKLQKAIIDQDENFKRKTKMIQRNVVRPRSALLKKKEKGVIATACKLSVILEKPLDIVKPKETSKPRIQQGRRALTVPKEPKFQNLHVPKSCTIRKPT